MYIIRSLYICVLFAHYSAGIGVLCAGPFLLLTVVDKTLSFFFCVASSHFKSLDSSGYFLQPRSFQGQLLNVWINDVPFL